MFFAAMEHDPHRAVRVHDVLAAWQRFAAQAPRATFGEMERAQIESGALPDPDELPRQMPLAALVFKRCGGCVVCHCLPDRWGGIPAKLDETGGQYVFWRCATGKCDLLVNAHDEAAVRGPSIAPRFGGADFRDAIATPDAAPIKTSLASRLELFCEECGLDFSIQSAEQIAALKQFAAWCDGQRPAVRVLPSTLDKSWAQWQFETTE